MADIHEPFMMQALLQAEKAMEMNEVPVGCVFVQEDHIIAKGHNLTNQSLNGTLHAEMVALQKIINSGSMTDFSTVCLYVTVEPCIMCAAALRIIGIKKVYFGCSNDRFGGNGSILNLHEDSYAIGSNYLVESGIKKDMAILLLRKFYLKENDRAPEPQRKSNRTLKLI